MIEKIFWTSLSIYLFFEIIVDVLRKMKETNKTEKPLKWKKKKNIFFIFKNSAIKFAYK